MYSRVVLALAGVALVLSVVTGLGCSTEAQEGSFEVRLPADELFIATDYLVEGTYVKESQRTRIREKTFPIRREGDSIWFDIEGLGTFEFVNLEVGHVIAESDSSAKFTVYSYSDTYIGEEWTVNIGPEKNQILVTVDWQSEEGKKAVQQLLDAL